MPDIYLLIEGQQQGPYTEEQVRLSMAGGTIPDDLPAWREGLTERVMSESSHQVVITGAQGSRQLLEREERRTFLTRFNHLNVLLRSGLTGSGQQLFPLTPQRDLEPDEGCYQDIDVPCFDLLHGTDIEVSQLSQLLLSHGLQGSLSSQVCTESLQFTNDRTPLWHALLGRIYELA